MKKTLIFLLLLVFISSPGYAIWGDSGNESKLQKGSYEKLINKNLELRNEVDSLIKDQEQLREIYKVLLEKVKTLQRDNALSAKDKEDSERTSTEARRTIEKMKRELAAANVRIVTMEGLMAREGAEAKGGTDVFYEKNALEKELKGIKDKITGQENESNKLTDQVKTQYAKVDTRAQKIDELSSKLKTALDSQGASGKALEEMRASLRKKDEELKAQYAKFTGEKEAALKDLETSQKTINDYTDQLKDESAKLARLKEDLSSSSSALKKQEKESETLRIASAAQDERIKEIEKSIIANNAIIKEQAEKLKVPEARISALEAELGKANESLKAAQGELNTKNEEAKKLAEIFDINALKKKYPDIFDRNNESEEFKNSPPAQRVRRAVDRVSAQRKMKAGKAQGIDRSIARARAEAKAIKDKVSAADAKVKELRETIAQVNDDMKNYTERAAAEEDRIRELEASLDKTSAQQKELEAKIEASPQKAAQIEESLKKLSSNLPKGVAPGFQTDEMKSLQDQLENARDEEKDLKDKLQSAENKIADLKDTISTSRAKSKQELAAMTAEGKKKIKTQEKDIVKTETEKNSTKREYQHIMKKIRSLGQARDAALADIRYEDEEISDLKKIVEREIVEINIAEGSGKTAKSGKISKAGLVDEAQNVLSTMREQIQALKTKNAELEKSLKNTENSEKKAERKADARKAFEADLLRKTNKERLNMHYNIAVVYDKNGMYKDAEREYLKCLDIDPNDPGVHYNLGILYDDKLNMGNKAKAHYKKYLEIVPKGENTYKVRQWLTDIELETRLGAEAR